MNIGINCKNTFDHLFKSTLMLVVLMMVAVSAFSQDYISKDNYEGNWNESTTWEPYDIPGTFISGIQVDIYGKITQIGGLDVAFSSSLTIHDTLIVEGEFSVSTSSDLYIEPGGVLIVEGNMTLLGSIFFEDASADNNGDLVVTGDLTSIGGDFNTQEGNTYVGGETDGNIPQEDTQTIDELAEQNPELYNEVNGCATKPDIALTTSTSTGCSGGIANFPYTNAENNPDQYKITFDQPALDAGFANVNMKNLQSSPITIPIPDGASVGGYSANLWVRNSTEGCFSKKKEITIQVVESPNPVITIDASSEYSLEDCYTEGNNLVMNVNTSVSGVTYSWSINPPDNDEGNPLNLSGETSQTVTISGFSNPNVLKRTYTIEVTVSFSPTCTETITKDFHLNRRPETGNTHHVPNDVDEQ
jgi:hypothetical protein